MATNAGVWIDHKQSTIVLLSDTGQEIKKVTFNLPSPVPTAGGAKLKPSYTRNDFVAEDRLERKVASDRKDYYDDVLAALHGVSTVLILGPGEAKGEFSKQIKAKKVRGLAVELETADKMTDRQLAAKVRQHFTTETNGKSKPVAVGKAKKDIVGKTTTPKKAAQTSSDKRTKKVGK